MKISRDLKYDTDLVPLDYMTILGLHTLSF